MPSGKTLLLAYFIGAAGLADVDIAFTNGTNVTTSTHTIIFGLGDKGKTCYACCFYENGHHQRGPQSVIVSKVVI